MIPQETRHTEQSGAGAREGRRSGQDQAEAGDGRGRVQVLKGREPREAFFFFGFLLGKKSGCIPRTPRLDQGQAVGYQQTQAGSLGQLDLCSPDLHPSKDRDSEDTRLSARTR